MVSFSIKQKVKEIGIRKVVGASNFQVTTHLSKDFILLILLAILFSYPLFWFLGNKFLQSFSYRIELSPLIYLGSVVIVLATAVLSIGWKSHEASIANPIDSLRDE